MGSSSNETGTASPLVRCLGSKQSGPLARVGCAGWSLSSKDSDSFPSSGTHLERYAQVFSCVEINSSFYRSHQAKTYARWAASVPATFRFSVKVPRTITHECRLGGFEVLLDAFVEQVGFLGDKLGYLLIQLPPSLNWDAALAARFLNGVRARILVPLALEARHESWFCEEADAVLSRAQVSRVHAHPTAILKNVGNRAPDEEMPRYWRLHGAPKIYYSAYDDAFLADVAKRILLTLEEGADAWCILDNTAAGEAILNALSLKRMVKGATN